MLQEEAVKHLQMLMTATQRLRSISAESGIITNEPEAATLGLTEATAADVWPWVWGEKSILTPLTKILDGYEVTGVLSPHDFYNIIFIATRLEPMLGMVAAILGDTDFPQEAKVQWLSGWRARV